MTTIAYKNGILAADNRCTFGRHRNAAKAHCRICGNSHQQVDDKTNKIHIDFNGCKWKGEDILVVTGSGSVTDIAHAMDIVRKGGDLVNILSGHLTFSGDSMLDFSLLIITDKQLHFISSENSKVTETLYAKTDELFFGSGQAYARFVSNNFNATAPQAIMAAIIGDNGSGGNITTFDTRPGKPKELVIYENLGVPGFRKLMSANNPFKTMEFKKEGAPAKAKPGPKPKTATEPVAKPAVKRAVKKAVPAKTPAVKPRTRKTTAAK